MEDVPSKKNPSNLHNLKSVNMGISFIVESAVASLFFFGCEVGAINQTAVMASAASSLEQCLQSETTQDNEGRLVARSVENECREKYEQFISKNSADDSAGGLIGQGNIFDSVYDSSRNDSAGVLDPAQPHPSAPVVTLTATPSLVQPGMHSQLQWSGKNIVVCDASSGWNGLRQNEGSESSREQLVNTNYVLTCYGPKGQASNSATVRVVNNNPAPTVSLTALPASVSSGSASTLSWTTTDASSCVASNAWTGPRLTTGSESSGALEQTSTYTLNCTGPGGTAGDSVAVSVDGAPPGPATFQRVTIEPDQAPWGKNLGDINGDGALDIIVGGGGLGGSVFWYRAPTWQKFQIGTLGGGDDLQTGDINGDGAIDVVINRDPIGWYENPLGSGGDPQGPWTLHTIGNYRSHDIALEDMNGDGKLDVVIRFAGFAPGARVILQGSNADEWTTISLTNDTLGTGGLAVADIDDDGRPDVVSDGYWLRQPEQNITQGSAWVRYDIGNWPAGSSIDTGDLNDDGNIDVSLAVSEVGTGALAWFEAPDDPLTQSWIRHDIGTVEDVHRHHLVDMNNDGKLDIVFAEMYQSATDRVGIYYNDGNNINWTLQVIETHASHNIAVGDIGNDGDMDILGANWQFVAPADGDVYLWINEIN